MFGKIKSMRFPRHVVAGHGVLDKVADVCKELGLQGKALIVTGDITKKIAGNKTKDILEDEGYATSLISVGEASEENIERVNAFARKEKIDFLLGVGGGSKIDIAKVASARIGKPFISIPTSGSHDGIASPRASIRGKSVFSVDASVPLGILADTSIICKAPKRMLAGGCADVLANLTAVKDWVLASRLKGVQFSSSAYALSKMAAEQILQNTDKINPGGEEGVWLAIKPLLASGASMCIANSSRPASGSEHLVAHALTQIKPGKALHGEACGLGAIMMMYLHDGNWEELRDALRSLGAPTTAKEVGVDKKTIVKALERANKIRPERYTILGDKGLSPESAEELATATGVI